MAWRKPPRMSADGLHCSEDRGQAKAPIGLARRGYGHDAELGFGQGLGRICGGDEPTAWIAQKLVDSRLAGVDPAFVDRLHAGGIDIESTNIVARSVGDQP